MTKFWCKQLMMVKPFEYILASDEALAAHLQVGDQVKVNDGMGRTEYRLTGFPTNTTESGEFTITSRIDKMGVVDGKIFYRARVRWPKSKLRFSFEDEHSDANISYFGDGKSVDVNINVSNADDVTIETDAGLTESNSIYIGDYILFPKIEILPDCTYYMTLAGEVLNSEDLPKIVPYNDQVFSFVVIKNNKQRYSKIVPVREVKPILTKTFTINATPSDAIVTYTINSCSHDWTQIGGTMYCYNGETVNYEVQREGYDTVTGSFTIPMTQYVRDYSINIPMTQTTEDPGTGSSGEDPDEGGGGIEPVGGDENFD